MRQRLKSWSLSVGVVLMLASCGTTAHIEKDDNADFSRYKTFAWLEKNDQGKDDRSKSNDFTEQRVKDAVSKELEKTGWRENRSKPDVYLSYDVLVERSIREQSDPVYSMPYTRTFYNPSTRRYFSIYYPSQFMGYDRNQRGVREGTVTISMIDARNDKTVWQGWTTDEVNSRNMSSKEIQQAVKSIFRKFDLAKN